MIRTPIVVGLLVLEVISATAAPTHTALREPKAGATCLGSVALGTGNIPVNNDLRTTVINAWAFTRNGKTAEGWLYENAAREYWLQVRKRTLPFRVVSEKAAIARMSAFGLREKRCFIKPLSI